MYKGLIKKSRTYDFAALLVILGAVQVALPTLLGPFSLSPEITGAATALIGLIVVILRTVTTGPVGEKPE
jgi:hypothetical protein